MNIKSIVFAFLIIATISIKSAVVEDVGIRLRSLINQGSEFETTQENFYREYGNTLEVNYLDLSRKNLIDIEGLQDIVENLGCSNLFIDLSHNNISVLPDWFYSLHDIVGLNLSHNNLTEVDLYGFDRLQELDLSNNQISGEIYIPKCIINVNISFNKIEGFTISKKAQFLDTFLASHNQITRVNHLFPYIYQRCMCDEENLNRLVVSPMISHIDLSYNNITEFNEKADIIDSLDLSHNNIKIVGILPKELRVLNLSNNELTKLSANVCKCKCLTKLDLSSNNITEISDLISHLEDVKVLKLDQNNIIKLPLNITHLKSLELLSMRGTQIDTFVKFLFSAECNRRDFKKFKKFFTILFKKRAFVYDVFNNEQLSIALLDIIPSELIGMISDNYNNC